MPRTPMEVFEDQISDAEQLLAHGRECLRKEASAPGRAHLRQAVVATAAAIECYVAAAADARLPTLLSRSSVRRGSEALPEPLAKVQVPFGVVYQAVAADNPAWALRPFLSKHLEQQASSTPKQISAVLRSVGFDRRNLFDQIDNRRGEKKKTTTTQLEQLTARRNQIAHTGDRTAEGRRRISPEVVAAFIRNAREVVVALDWLLHDESSPTTEQPQR